jgi:C1A family cysteine protease
MNKLLAVIFLGFSLVSFSQKRATGMIFDPPSLRSIPYKAKLTTNSYGSTPSYASLEKYCPTPGDQGSFGTCVAFATAYHLRTILYAKSLSENGNSTSIYTNPNAIIFSPTFIYEGIKEKQDINCQDGTNPVDAFQLMKKVGVVKLKTLPYSCGTKIKNEILNEASQFTISDYQILFSPDETDGMLKINSIKKAISEGYPCMLGFIVAESFYGVKGDVWKKQSTDDGPSGKHGRHAMCIVGYDNNKYGGAFRVMNSWGTSWADKGFVWIPYSDFAEYAITAIQAYIPQINKEEPVNPIVDVIDVRLNGGIQFQKNTGETMALSLFQKKGNNQPEKIVSYKMNETYQSGTRFRFLLTTNTESFIYAFATDLTGKINKILPFADNMSPRIGSNSTIAFPSESKVVKMDENPGTDYLVILYSKEKLDSDYLVSKMSELRGSLANKIETVLGDKLILPSDINFNSNELKFFVKNNAKGNIVPLLIEIPHQ